MTADCFADEVESSQLKAFWVILAYYPNTVAGKDCPGVVVGCKIIAERSVSILR
jgi:hypothetical protein